VGTNEHKRTPGRRKRKTLVITRAYIYMHGFVGGVRFIRCGVGGYGDGSSAGDDGGRVMRMGRLGHFARGYELRHT
jgi:hypothetical protein